MARRNLIYFNEVDKSGHFVAWEQPELYEKASDWASFVITDGRLVTGQNPASSNPAPKALLKLLN